MFFLVQMEVPWIYSHFHLHSYYSLSDIEDQLAVGIPFFKSSRIIL